MKIEHLQLQLLFQRETIVGFIWNTEIEIADRTEEKKLNCDGQYPWVDWLLVSHGS
jgi:hypothetical protein